MANDLRFRQPPLVRFLPRPFLGTGIDVLQVRVWPHTVDHLQPAAQYRVNKGLLHKITINSKIKSERQQPLVIAFNNANVMFHPVFHLSAGGCIASI